MIVKYKVPDIESSLMEWLNYINNIHYKNIDLSLDRVLMIFNQLDLSFNKVQVILVGGTNGKGTTCYLLESILLASGFRVGLYTSPHLLSYSERIRIQGKTLPEIMHVKSMSLIESIRGTLMLSYFEFTTLSALYLFQQSQLDIVILEVGLGGRLDATNIINPDVSVITNISLDHTDLLGIDDISIAREKSGILRFNKPAVIGDLIRPAILDIMSEYSSSLFIKDLDWRFYVERDRWFWYTSNVFLEYLPLPKIPLNNAATAIAVLHCLPLFISESDIYEGLRNTVVPGRFQIINKNPFIILDVAHNVHAANYLVKCLQRLYFRGKLRVLVGMLTNKDICGTLKCLHNLVDFWYCVSLNVPLGANSAELASHIAGKNVYQFNNVIDAWFKVLKDANTEDCILVFGSFNTVSPIMQLTNSYIL